MKKALVLALGLVLVLGAGAFAADYIFVDVYNDAGGWADLSIVGGDIYGSATGSVGTGVYDDFDISGAAMITGSGLYSTNVNSWGADSMYMAAGAILPSSTVSAYANSSGGGNAGFIATTTSWGLFGSTVGGN